MAHFAELDENNLVLRVVVVSNAELDSNGAESESKGIDFLQSLYGHRRWVQTSYNGSIRGAFAGIGYRYDSQANEFVEQPSSSDLIKPVPPSAD